MSAAERMRAYRARLKQSGAVRRTRPPTAKQIDHVDRQRVQDGLNRAAGLKAEYERLRAEYDRLQAELKATSQLHWAVTKEIVVVQRALQAAQPARTARRRKR